MAKPKCKLTGQDGNAFMVIGLVSRALKQAGQHDKAKEFQAKAMTPGMTYTMLLGSLVNKYVEVS